MTSIVARAEISDHIENEQRLAKIYRDSDIFVLPSISEGFPRVLTEAMSMKLPVVTTKAGGIPYVLSNGEHAVLTEIRDPKSLVESIEKLVQNDELRLNIISNGYELGMARIGTDPLEQHMNELSKHLGK
jgi:glycosyltransferase involved in cell wall biosynthesis